MKQCIIAGLVFVLIGGAAAVAQDTKATDTQERRRLELTQEQRDKIRDIRLEWKKEQAQLRTDRQVAQLELRKLLGTDNPAEAEIRILLEKTADIDVSLKMGAIKNRNAIMNVLTPEQRELLKNRRLNLNLRDFTRHSLLHRFNRSMRLNPQRRLYLRQRWNDPRIDRRFYFRRDEIPELNGLEPGLLPPDIPGGLYGMMDRYYPALDVLEYPEISDDLLFLLESELFWFGHDLRQGFRR